ncbi:MAG: DUF3160 domain-containing protein [Anaerolineae bacterium]|nr:DUF3160 domain-containing protein [Anaerolineae bacterium]
MKKWLFIIVLLMGILPLSAQTDDIPPVIPTDNPTSLNTAVVNWDWNTYTADSYWADEGIPDPLSTQLPQTYMGDLPALPIDLSQVAWVDELGFSEEQLAILAQNGFVVVPSGLNFFDEAYQEYNENVRWDVYDSNTAEMQYRPYWISTDALLHTLYLNFENLLKFTETDYLRYAMNKVLARSYSKSYETYQALAGTPLESQAYGATVFFAVGLGLFNIESDFGGYNPALDGQTQSQDDGGYWIVQDVQIREQADAIINLARNATGLHEIPFLNNYQEDFSQYKPRGHYTTSPALEDYFRGMMWLGRITFLAKDDSSLVTSLLVLKALNESGELTTWREVADFITFLIGDEDNLGPIQYLPLAESIFGAGMPIDTLDDAVLLEAFRQEVYKLPAPKISNVKTEADVTEEDLPDLTRGFRLFGQRFTFDAYVLQNLINPYVKANTEGLIRPLPSALDVASVLGSDVAYELLVARGDTQFADFTANMTMLREQVNTFTAEDWFKNIYGGWLWALQPLFVRRDEAYPPMMSTRAWQLKDIQTGLGSYVELKHATVLYAAQPEGRGGGGGGIEPVLPVSMVEPNPYVFARIAIIATALQPKIEAFAEASTAYYSNLYPVSFTLEILAKLSARLAYLSQKQMFGETLTYDEQYFLKFDVGSILSGIRTSLSDLIAPEDRPPFSAVVTDIATNSDMGQVLQIGTGKINYIYVVVTAEDGTLQLARGATYSFYEFTNDINNRLNDTQWRGLIEAGRIPPRPDWTAEFMGQP